jgi:hypothetical protein
VEEQECTFYITTSENVPVNVTIRHKCAESELDCESFVSVDHTRVASYTPPHGIRLSTNPSLRVPQSRNGIHLKADNNKVISVVVLMDGVGSADAYLGLPLPNVTTKPDEFTYYAVSAPPPTPGNTPSSSFVAVVTNMANTSLQIQPGDSDMTRYYNSFCSNDSHCFFPEEGMVIIIVKEQDLTGTKVIADKPITFLTGHECANMPSDIGNCDHMVEQFPPVADWGTKFIFAPLESRTAYAFRIVASQSNTNVNIVCGNEDGNERTHKTVNLTAGEYHHTIVNSTHGYCFVSSNHPVMTTQYNLGYKYDNNNINIPKTDPFLLQIPPFELFHQKHRVLIPKTKDVAGFNKNAHITLIIPSTFYQPSQIVINSSTLQGRILGNQASVGIVRNNAGEIEGYTVGISVSRRTGSLEIYHTDVRAYLGITVYGYGQEKSFGYVGSFGSSRIDSEGRNITGSTTVAPRPSTRSPSQQPLVPSSTWPSPSSSSSPARPSPSPHPPPPPPPTNANVMIGFTERTYFGSEDNRFVQVTLQKKRIGKFSQDVEVIISLKQTADVGLPSARRNIDFNAEQFPLSITIPSAEKRVIFNISLGQDNEQGSRKVFQLSLSISKPLKGVFIENNKEEANIVINAYNAPEHCQNSQASIACWADSIRGGNVTTVEGQIANLMLVRTGEADTLEKECFTIQTLDETATRNMDFKPPAAGNCCFEKGSSETTCFVRILKDNMDENVETFKAFVHSYNGSCPCTGPDASVDVRILRVPDELTAASLSVEMGVLIGVLVVIAVLLPVGLCLVVLLVCRLKRKPVHKELSTDEAAIATIKLSALECDKEEEVHYANMEWHPPVDKWEVNWSNFKLEDKIGSGHYGSVFKGILDMTFNTNMFKTYKEEMMKKGKSPYTIAVKTTKGGLETEDIEAFLSEIQTMKKVSEGNNPHIVRMLGCVTASIPAALLLEYVPHGNLRTFLQQHKPLNWTSKADLNDEEDDGYINKDSLPRINLEDSSDSNTLHQLNNNDFVSFGYQIASGMVGVKIHTPYSGPAYSSTV